MYRHMRGRHSTSRTEVRVRGQIHRHKSDTTPRSSAMYCVLYTCSTCKLCGRGQLHCCGWCWRGTCTVCSILHMYVHAGAQVHVAFSIGLTHLHRATPFSRAWSGCCQYSVENMVLRNLYKYLYDDWSSVVLVCGDEDEDEMR